MSLDILSVPKPLDTFLDKEIRQFLKEEMEKMVNEEIANTETRIRQRMFELTTKLVPAISTAYHAHNAELQITLSVSERALQDLRVR